MLAKKSKRRDSTEQNKAAAKSMSDKNKKRGSFDQDDFDKLDQKRL